MMKYSGALCHLHCTDCFCINEVQLAPECNVYCMDDTALKLFIRQKIDAQEASDVFFTWQDSESISDGLHFFKRVIRLQQQFAQSKNIINTFLTNGFLLNDDWCEFFRNNQFMICISVDSDVSLHDYARETISGKSANYQVENAVRLLQKHDVEFSTLTVINAFNSQHPLRIYHYLKSLGSRHMQFIPFIKPLAQGGVDARSLAPAALGIFLKTIFYAWVRLDVGTIKIPLFEHAFAAWCELSLSANDVMTGSNQPTVTRESLVEECTRCKVAFACHGGCAKDRTTLPQCGVPKLNYYCESYQAFFTYVEPYMLMMRALWEQNYAPSDIRHYLA